MFSQCSEKVIASEGLVGMQEEVLELLSSVDTKLDYQKFLAATMGKVHHEFGAEIFGRNTINVKILEGLQVPSSIYCCAWKIRGNIICWINRS